MGTLKINSILDSGIRQYKIDKILGQGSFGITYLASTRIKVEGPLGNIETPIKVAIKEFFMRDLNGRTESTVTCSTQSGLYDKYKDKFIKEAQSLSKLSHPHIIKVLEVFENNNTQYYVMEYCEGGSLDDKISARGGLSEEETLKYTGQIMSALSYMHAHHMLHLDLKPGNVMLRSNGEAVLIDFGLSKQFDESGHPESSTTIGGGTPGYAPLEQSNYDGRGFPKTMDVYALGGTMFKMLTGNRPPEASMILNYGFPTEELQNHNVSQHLISCIAKAMSFRVSERPQDIESLERLLESDASSSESTQFVSSPVTDEATVMVETETQKKEAPKKETPKKETPVQAPETPKKKKSKAWILLVSIVVLLLFGGMCAFIWNVSESYDLYKAWISQGNYKMEQSDWSNAAWYYERALGKEREYGDLFYYLGYDMYSVRQGLEKAEAKIAADKDAYLGYVSQGDTYLKKNKLTSAKTEYNKALEIETKYSSTNHSHMFSQYVQNKITEVDNKIKQENAKYNGHKYVNLGLSVKWATCNVGASKPEDYGNYYAWGETSTKSSYTSDNSKTNGKSMGDIKGNSSYDAARANWGGKWRMPTESEMQELIDRCNWIWTTQNGVKGYKVTGPNGNSIFLPAAGFRNGSSLFCAGSYGYYWSYTPDGSLDRAYSLDFNSDGPVMDFLYRYYGFSVRPVLE